MPMTEEQDDELAADPCRAGPRPGRVLEAPGFLLCGDDGQAEDLVQDALVRAFAPA
jgi:hypothetical protein